MYIDRKMYIFNVDIYLSIYLNCKEGALGRSTEECGQDEPEPPNSPTLMTLRISRSLKYSAPISDFHI